MKKLIIGTLITAAMLAASAPAFAGWYDPYGNFHGCGWFYGDYGWVWLCYR